MVLAAAYAEIGDFESALRFARQSADLAPESEKETRRARIRQYEQGIPFRLPGGDRVTTNG